MLGQIGKKGFFRFALHSAFYSLKSKRQECWVKSEKTGVFSDLPYIQPFTLLRVKHKNVGSNRKKRPFFLPNIQPFTLLRVKDKNVGSNRKKLKRKEYIDNAVHV